MNKTRSLIFGSVVVASMIFGGIVSATVFARTGSQFNVNAASAAASPSPGPFKSNEAAAHETGESAAQETAENNGTFHYGGPGSPGRHESKPLTAPQEQRMRGLLEACWRYLDQVVAKAPPDLRKGPRGGGRDRDNMFDHVLGAEMEYAKRIGIRLKQPDGRDSAAVRAFRKAILVGIDNPAQGIRWPVPYAIRRTASHALDHPWEIEDRSPP